MICLATILAQLSSGCAFLKKTIGLGLVRPKLQLESLDFLGAEGQTIFLAAHLSVYNPNDVDLTLSDLQYRLYLGKTLLAQGVYKEKLTFPAESRQDDLRLRIRIGPVSPEFMLTMLLRESHASELIWKSELLFHSSLGTIPLQFEGHKNIRKSG